MYMGGMGVTKAENFKARENTIALLCKALAHPARVAILMHLARVDKCIGGEIVEEIPLSQPTISRHLRELQQIGLIKGTIDGNRVNYCIDAERWKLARDEINELFDHFVSDHECC